MKLLFFILFSVTMPQNIVEEMANDTTMCPTLDSVAIENIEQTTVDLSTIELASNTPDSVFIERLQQLPFVVELPYNQVIRRYILRYLQHSPKLVADLKRKEEFYFPIFEDILTQYDLPCELAYLPIIESALNPNARSHMGAVGLWQFMPATGKKYGLEINSLVDERRDPIKSTHAAAKFMKALYSVFGDWNLAIAAYNCGPGNVNKAIYRAGGKRDFWSIYPYLPKETRAYLPLYIAAVYSMNYAYIHGITTNSEPLFMSDTTAVSDSILFPNLERVCVYEPMPTDTVVINQRMHLLQISECIDVPLQVLRQLNPQYARDIVPGNKDYAVCLPIDKAGLFVMHQDSILAHRANELVHNRRTEIDLLQKTSVNGAYTVNGVTYYKIKEGDTLGGIAAKFRVSVKQLKAWNNLNSDMIRAGKTLKILQ
jgi:membrane-bound lytic murein transglycosylase D